MIILDAVVMLELELVAMVKLMVTLQVGDTVVELEGAGGAMALAVPGCTHIHHHW